MNILKNLAPWMREYRSSLKAPAAEEMIDLIMYRPLAFFLARGLRNTLVKPSHVTIASMGAGVTGGILLGLYPEHPAILALAFIWFSTLLDCADGQLARLQNRASVAGRILDGMIDYVVGLALFLGIAWRGGPAFNDPTWWFLVVGAGVSYGLQAMFYDLVRTEYLSKISGGQQQPTAGDSVLQQSWVYRWYLQCQSMLDRLLEGVGEDERTKRFLRFWGLNGTSTHVTVLVILGIFNRLDLYLWYLMVVGNAMTVVLVAAWQSTGGSGGEELRVSEVHVPNNNSRRLS